MLDNTSTPSTRFVFFISRLAILGGMVLFFGMIGHAIGALVCNSILGIDFIHNPTLLSNFKTDAKALQALKLLQICVTIGAMLIPAWFFPKALEQYTPTFLQTTFRFNPIYIVYAIALVFLSAPFISWLIEMNSRLQFPASMHRLELQLQASEAAATELTKVFITSNTLSELLVTLFIVALLPAITEELLFRGALQQFTKLCFGNVHLAVILSAALFSAFHGQIYGFVPRMVIGIMLGYLFAYSNSVWPGVLAHFVNNTIAVLASHFAVEQTKWSVFSESYQFPFYIVCISAACCIVLLFGMYIAQHKSGNNDE